MNVVILTSNALGSVSLHLETLAVSDKINISMVILSEGKITNKKKYYTRRFKKMAKIGFLGALNGVRMRKWYTDRTFEHLELERIDHLCKKHGIVFKTTPTINCEKTMELFREANADLGLSIGNPYISQRVFNIPKHGMLNVHYEELPKYQNAIGVVWQIFNESRYTGYTIHQVDKHIDTGKILLKETFPIIFKNRLSETVSRTYAEAWKKSVIGMVNVLEDFDHFQEQSIPQKNGEKYTTPTILQFMDMLKKHRKLRSGLTHVKIGVYYLSELFIDSLYLL